MSNEKNKGWENVSFYILGRKIEGVKGFRLNSTEKKILSNELKKHFPKSFKRYPRKLKKKISKQISKLLILKSK